MAARFPGKHMAFIIAENKSAGPVVQAWVSWDADTIAYALTRGTAAPDEVPVKLLIDTGATITSISGDVIRRLNLTPRDAIKLRTASSDLLEDRPVYHVAISLSDSESVSAHKVVRVIAYPSRNDGVDGLLGWDVLQHCNLFYSKETRLFSLSF